MLKQRLLTAIILIPLVLLGLFQATLPAFYAVLLLALLALTVEWLQLIPLKKSGYQILFICCCGLGAALIPYIFDYWLMGGCIIWILLGYFILHFPKSTAVWGKRGFVAFSGILLLPLFIQSQLALFKLDQGRYLILYLLFLVWIADSAAYFAGKLLGRHKLIPLVSPGKTLEGLAGGLLFSLIIAIPGYYLFKPSAVFLWFVFNLCMYFVTVMGDLLISMLKRRVNIKDTGRLFPGHGGILDRLDSLIAASPFFYAGMLFFLNGYTR